MWVQCSQPANAQGSMCSCRLQVACLAQTVSCCYLSWLSHHVLSLTTLQMPATVAALPPELWSSKLRRIALGDWLARKLAAEANRASAAAAGQAQGWHGAKGGDVTVDLPGAVTKHTLHVRLDVRHGRAPL